eukprot:scaffold319_cov244-Pinguiococcus_pyrenoidosus.AAC.29
MVRERLPVRIYGEARAALSLSRSLCMCFLLFCASFVSSKLVIYSCVLVRGKEHSLVRIPEQMPSLRSALSSWSDATGRSGCLPHVIRIRACRACARGRDLHLPDNGAIPAVLIVERHTGRAREVSPRQIMLQPHVLAAPPVARLVAPAQHPPVIAVVALASLISEAGHLLIPAQRRPTGAARQRLQLRESSTQRPS